MIYVLDCGRMTSREDAHAYIAETLAFPAYYGNNLDALYDCLTDMRGDEIILRNVSAAGRALGEYGDSMISVFVDACKAGALRLTMMPY